MGRMSRKIKERAMEILESDEYQEEKTNEFTNQLNNEMKRMNIEEMDIDFFQGFIDSFDFPDEDEWAMDKACGEADDYGDQKYQSFKDDGIL